MIFKKLEKKYKETGVGFLTYNTRSTEFNWKIDRRTFKMHNILLFLLKNRKQDRS